MPVDTYSRFVSLLAFAALATGVIALVRPRMFAQLGFRNGVGLAALVALGSTAGSLVYSEYYLFEPCRLCWYQRIAMYPLVVTLGIGWWRSDRAVVRYVVPPAVIGGGISLWHLANQWLLTEPSCAVGASCAVRYVTEFGFVTIPFMAFSGFAAITGLLIAVRKQ
ncbi:MAG: disulfide bond formation protein B [Acidimicrobiia bacterium]|nr:disulfide bond formation protein B [Acidimicrobiia bacterium]